jgi:hypothetical protein
MNSNIVSPKAMNVIFQIIDFAFQKALVAQLIVRMPFIRI